MKINQRLLQLFTALQNCEITTVQQLCRCRVTFLYILLSTRGFKRFEAE